MHMAQIIWFLWIWVVFGNIFAHTKRYWVTNWFEIRTRHKLSQFRFLTWFEISFFWKEKMARRKINPPNPKPIARVTHRKPKQSPAKRKPKVFGAKIFKIMIRGSFILVHEYLVLVGLYHYISSCFFTPYKGFIQLHDKRKRCKWET